MLATKVKLSELNTFDELDEARDAIENDYLNVVGGMAAWRSGYETHLTAAAKRKLAAIDAKMEAMEEDDD